MFTFFSPVVVCIAKTVQHSKYGRPCSNIDENEKMIVNDYVSSNHIEIFSLPTNYSPTQTVLMDTITMS